jgi:hypothetical protein
MALAARLALEQLTDDDSRAVAAAATAALGAPAPVPPRPARPELALSDTVIDLGRLPQHGQSPEYRVMISNAGSGDLNARAATSASWLKLRRAGDELVVAADTTASGEYEGTVTVDSDGGTAAVRVHAHVDPAPLPDRQAQELFESQQPTDEPLAEPGELLQGTAGAPRPTSVGQASAEPLADQSKGRSAAESSQEPRHSAKREATEQSGQAAANVAQPQVVEPRPPATLTAAESGVAPQPTIPAVPSAARPPIRRGAAFAGTMIALLAGVAGLISQLLLNNSGYIRSNEFFFSLVIYVVVIVASLAALMRIRQLVTIGFLQGMLWLGLPSLGFVILVISKSSLMPGGELAAYVIEITGLVLGVIAAILLMISWSPAVDRRQARQIRGFPVMLLGVVGLSQIPILTFYASLPYDSMNYIILGGAGALVILAVTWYAMSLRARALGGALVLGWVTVSAMLLIMYMTSFWGGYAGAPMGVARFSVILGYVLLAAVVALTIIYMRGPSDPESSAN